MPGGRPGRPLPNAEKEYPEERQTVLASIAPKPIRKGARVPIKQRRRAPRRPPHLRWHEGKFAREANVMG